MNPPLAPSCRFRRRGVLSLLSVLASIPMLAGSANAQVSYAGGTYSQNFDTLPSSGTFTVTGAGPFGLNASPVNASGLSGWSFAKTGGSGSNALFNVGTGSGNTGSVYSFGAASASERALGMLLSGSVESTIGVALVNNTGSTITSFSIAYTGEQWRQGGSSGVTDKLKFEYAVNAASVISGTFTAVPSLDFSGPATGATGAALDGNGAANRASISGTVSGITWPAGQTLVIRWTDLNISGADCGLAVDDFSFSTSGGGDPVPAVASTVPSQGATAVGISAPLTVTFNTAVTVANGGITLSGANSGSVSVSVTGGPTTFTVTPSASLAYNETYTLGVTAASVTDQATGSLHPTADTTVSFTTMTQPGSGTPIHAIQGNGSASPLANQTVVASGIVTGFYLNSDGTRAGFYLQAADADADSDPNTSEGIYVYANGSSAVTSTLATLATGDTISVSGTVKEFNTLTELDTLTALSKTGTAPLPTPVTVTLPFTSSTTLEKVEGMLITLPQTLHVTNNYYLGRYGEFDVSSGGVLQQPTNVVAPGAPALAKQAANNLNLLTVDDGSSKEDPDTTPYLFGGGTPVQNTLRTGDTVAGLTGVVTYLSATSYMLEPTVAPVFTRANPRVGPPAVGGSLKVVGANVLNFFNGDGTGGGFPTERGATTEEELVRQRKHIVTSLLQLNADIYGLTEMENDGFGTTSAIRDLVNALNAAAPSGTTYTFSNPGVSSIGTDAITCAIIYKSNTVAPVGSAVVNTASIFNRPPLAQTFRQIATNEKFTICVNHFKSKGSPPSSGVDTDQGDGQSAWNNRRTQQANTLATWLATNPTGDADPDILVIGDLNSYAKEDPITALKNAGYSNQIERFEGEGGYSYQFDAQFGHLDHVMASAGLHTQITGAQSWHNNADEPVFLDYNTEYKSAFAKTVNDGDTPWRASDHDPVVVGITLGGFNHWIAGFPQVGGMTGFRDDFDHDGIPNGLENFFGTHPGVANAGLTPVSAASGHFTFRHPHGGSVATDISGSYEWSGNLTDWHSSGETVGGTTVVIGTTPVSQDTLEVAADVTSGTASALFLRVKAQGPGAP
ncbi:ExeM/NucH family extracellular endonuclease [Luteolibacter ambystomatis]|uniref:ExeM/NucH family extracellular endonuclease n=1 Tax=Luteolibacter ambystomatis TaxID=2824561 RepID=A0A975G818_9BACT|nr:ExeM/NucH family extracellular endonuclease [Luteolibacter ambystomatis]QUE51042.1 ExeM/NucH family extracellular endonuclease [Luteolibacter ambystomatis]